MPLDPVDFPSPFIQSYGSGGITILNLNQRNSMTAEIKPNRRRRLLEKGYVMPQGGPDLLDPDRTGQGPPSQKALPAQASRRSCRRSRTLGGIHDWL